MQKAGDGKRARELLLSGVSRMSSAMDWGAMRISVTAECTRAALEDWQREGGSPHEGIMLRRMLLGIDSEPVYFSQRSVRRD